MTSAIALCKMEIGV